MFCENSLTGDKKWCLQHEPEGKRKTRIGKQVIYKSQIKGVLVAFFDITCIVQVECIRLGQTVSQTCFVETVIAGLIP